ncbi:hypothetical protein L484_002715 [Morus notabilis]|uniref:Uncharacterized protein n=1 Tax=Morus notabilis TaxID=981085 RepID=W9RG92_9ROSA|nr:hypothetical protein L484_002715 [Morus notabilis]
MPKWHSCGRKSRKRQNANLMRNKATKSGQIEMAVDWALPKTQEPLSCQEAFSETVRDRKSHRIYWGQKRAVRGKMKQN